MITDYRPLYPYMLLTALGALLALLDAFTRKRRESILGWIAAFGALVALALDWGGTNASPWNGVVVFDGFSRAFDTVFLLSLAVVCIGSAGREERMAFAGEFYALLIFSTIGLMLMAASGGLIVLYLGIELSTVCLFALAGFTKRERKSAESALKLFVLGAVASAVLLYGSSLVYGAVMSLPGASSGTQFDAIASALSLNHGALSAVLWVGIAFVVGGIAFKIAAAPFHLWAPDVYEGAPTTVSAYLSTASKAGGFAALLRFLFAALAPASSHWIPVVAVLAVLSMVLGNLVAINQSSLKRLLAYSGVAQAGYILVAVAAGPQSALTTGAIVMYLILYAFTNAGGFLLVQAVEDATGSDDITALRGLHKRNGLLAAAMLIFLFSLGGIPPLAGFVGKLYLFAAGWGGGQYALVLVGAVTSVIALYYYLMVALQVYIRDPEDDRRMTLASPLATAIAICAAATLLIGVYPRPWVELGAKASATTSQAVATRPTKPLEIARH
jgi:NADH-quinone oxidoreductase subunit N